MITITPAAADQIRTSANQGGNQNLAMRIAAKRNPDGSIHYGMGFDENEHEGDIHVTSAGIDVVISETSKILLDGEAHPNMVESIKSTIEAESDNRVSDLHLWRVGPCHFAASITVLTHEPQPPD